MTPPLRLVVLLLVVTLGACGGEAPSAPDAGPDAVADALPPPSEQPPPDAASPADALDADVAPPPDLVAMDAPDDDGQAPPDASPADAAAEPCGDLETDTNNCGACGRRCTFPNATPSCVRGLCGIAACARGFADCNRRNDDGCEQDTNEGANCGVCNNRCPAGSRCVGGLCEGACPVPMTPGGAWCFDRCQDLNITGDHCGSCGNRCPAGTVCGNGACCRPGFADCNRNPADGCETDVNTAENCGQCGNPCVRPRFCRIIESAPGVITGHMCR